MCNNFFLQEKRIEEHVRDLQQEADQQRVATGLSRKRPGVAKHMLSRLGTRLVVLGTWLERIEQGDNVIMPVRGALQRSHK